MKKTFYILLFTLSVSVNVFSQETLLSPINNPAINKLIKSETSQMDWFMFQDTLKVQIGKVHTEIQKKKKNIYIITTVDMAQSPTKWIDSTIVGTLNFEPKYHSSYNQQRDMVLEFGEKITGYYLDKKTETKTEISEEVETSFFDSNFYPQLIRFLPLMNGYSKTISIFDYNPTAEIGVITATIKNAEEITINFNGKERSVWKVETTDDISNNTAVSTYYIDTSTRKILKQEIDFGGRKMLMELVE
ncbi:DUF3108 domain-containing protein [Aureibaculum luteum]|uniref:DUF3108 domain-containing protein n=1 Tax=Aureibaculum luteum TaxID=1548456 RepID=UPI000E4A01C5|nr:hypothetical protein [Aureibaculum luteum]